MGSNAQRKRSSAAEREYRFERMSDRTTIAIPANYTSHDVAVWKDQLGKRMDRAFEKIWVNLSDDEKIRINKALI